MPHLPTILLARRSTPPGSPVPRGLRRNTPVLPSCASEVPAWCRRHGWSWTARCSRRAACA